MDMIFFDESTHLKYSRNSHKRPPWKLKKWSLARMSSGKRLHGKTKEGGRLFEEIKKLMFN